MSLSVLFYWLRFGAANPIIPATPYNSCDALLYVSEVLRRHHAQSAANIASINRNDKPAHGRRKNKPRRHPAINHNITRTRRRSQIACDTSHDQLNTSLIEYVRAEDNHRTRLAAEAAAEHNIR